MFIQPKSCLTGICAPHGNWQRHWHICTCTDTQWLTKNVSSLLVLWLFLRPSGYSAVILYCYSAFDCSAFPFCRTRILSSTVTRYSFNSNICWAQLSFRHSARQQEGCTHAKDTLFTTQKPTIYWVGQLSTWNLARDWKLGIL